MAVDEKNFSEINQNLLVKEGNTLSTISVMKNILADAEVSESFPKECGIYDLNDFLAKVSVHDDFEEDLIRFCYLHLGPYQSILFGVIQVFLLRLSRPLHWD